MNIFSINFFLQSSYDRRANNHGADFCEVCDTYLVSSPCDSGESVNLNLTTSTCEKQSWKLHMNRGSVPHNQHITSYLSIHEEPLQHVVFLTLFKKSHRTMNLAPNPRAAMIIKTPIFFKENAKKEKDMPSRGIEPRIFAYHISYECDAVPLSQEGRMFNLKQLKCQMTKLEHE
jgi:hypothetical protein